MLGTSGRNACTQLLVAKCALTNMMNIMLPKGEWFWRNGTNWSSSTDVLLQLQRIHLSFITISWNQGFAQKSYYFINNFLFSSAIYGFDSTSRACERQNVSNSFPFNILTEQLINVFCLAIKWILKNSSNHISLICWFNSLNLPSAGNSAGNCDSVVLNTYLKCFIHHHF